MKQSRHPSRQRLRRRPVKLPAVIVAAAALTALAFPPAAAAQAAGLPALTCSAHTLAVRIADPGPADQDMWGQLCYRGSHAPATWTFKNPLKRERQKTAIYQCLQMTVQPVRQTFLFGTVARDSTDQALAYFTANRTIEWTKSCRPRANIVVPQGFATGAYARSAKEKAIACSSAAAGHRSG